MTTLNATELRHTVDTYIADFRSKRIELTAETYLTGPNANLAFREFRASHYLKHAKRFFEYQYGVSNVVIAEVEDPNCRNLRYDSSVAGVYDTLADAEWHTLEAELKNNAVRYEERRIKTAEQEQLEKQAAAIEKAVLKTARKMYACDDVDILDDIEKVDDGHWVSARVFISDADADLECPECDNQESLEEFARRVTNNLI